MQLNEPLVMQSRLVHARGMLSLILGGINLQLPGSAPAAVFNDPPDMGCFIYTPGLDMFNALLPCWRNFQPKGRQGMVKATF